MRSSLKISLPILFLVAFCFSLQDVGIAHACTCVAARPVYEMYQDSDAVFSGMVLDVNSTSLELVNVTLAVSHAWKGASGSTVALTTSSSGASCGFSFQRGVEYLVYAKNLSGQLNTGLCSGTKLLSEAQGDIFWLDLTAGLLRDFLIGLAASAAIVILASIWLLRRQNPKLSKKHNVE